MANVGRDRNVADISSTPFYWSTVPGGRTSKKKDTLLSLSLEIDPKVGGVTEMTNGIRMQKATFFQFNSFSLVSGPRP